MDDVSNKKSKRKARAKHCNIISPSLKEIESDLTPLTDIEEENNIIIA